MLLAPDKKRPVRSGASLWWIALIIILAIILVVIVVVIIVVRFCCCRGDTYQRMQIFWDSDMLLKNSRGVNNTGLHSVTVRRDFHALCGLNTVNLWRLSTMRWCDECYAKPQACPHVWNGLPLSMQQFHQPVKTFKFWNQLVTVHSDCSSFAT